MLLSEKYFGKIRNKVYVMLVNSFGKLYVRGFGLTSWRVLCGNAFFMFAVYLFDLLKWLP